MFSISFVSAALPIGFGVERCNESDFGNNKTVELESGCGNQTLECKLFVRPPGYLGIVPPKTGLWWAIQSYDPGEGICCDPEGG